MAIKKYVAPDETNKPGFRAKDGSLKGRFSQTEKTRVLKTLQMNGFNYMLTERQTGVSTVTLKKWRLKHPEVFANDYTTKSLASIEYVAKEETKKIISHSGKLLKLSLEQAERLLEFETDLGKVASFIRAITPLAKDMAEIDRENGYQKVSSLTQTLAKLALLNGNQRGIEDAEITE